MSDIRSDQTDEHYQKVISNCHEDNLIGPLEDGYQYFWTNRGALSARDLRIIAEELDRLNKDWDTKTRQFFEDLD
jgi:hypothetical protein